MSPTVLVVGSRGAQRRICLRPGPAATPVGGGRIVATEGAQKVGLGMCPKNTPRRPWPVIPAKTAKLAMGSAATAMGSSLGSTTAYLRPGPVATATGEGGDAAAAGALESSVRRCLVTPPTAPPAGDPREEGQPGDGPYCDNIGVSLSPSKASLRPGPVATAAGEGRGAAAARVRRTGYGGT